MITRALLLVYERSKVKILVHVFGWSHVSFSLLSHRRNEYILWLRTGERVWSVKIKNNEHCSTMGLLRRVKPASEWNWLPRKLELWTVHFLLAVVLFPSSFPTHRHSNGGKMFSAPSRPDVSSSTSVSHMFEKSPNHIALKWTGAFNREDKWDHVLNCC